jgi:hypothetical protein
MKMRTFGIGALAAALLIAVSAYAADPFDGSWTGESADKGCGVSKFNFMVRDNTVSGYVGGLLHGQLARGEVLSGTVAPDGTARIVWGRNNHFRGDFRFSGDALIGNYLGACGSNTMSGRPS